MDFSYIKGVENLNGDKVIRALNKEELEFLDKFAKEHYHANFNTDEESKALFKLISSKVDSKANQQYFLKNNRYPDEVEKLIKEFEKKTKSLGNITTDIFKQKESYSSDYCRRFDLYNKMHREFRLDSFDERPQSVDGDESMENTFIEDLISENED